MEIGSYNGVILMQPQWKADRCAARILEPAFFFLMIVNFEAIYYLSSISRYSILAMTASLEPSTSRNCWVISIYLRKNILVRRNRIRSM